MGFEGAGREEVVFLVSEFVSIRTDIFVAGIGVERVSNRGALRLEIINWVATGNSKLEAGRGVFPVGMRPAPRGLLAVNMSYVLRGDITIEIRAV